MTSVPHDSSRKSTGLCSKKGANREAQMNYFKNKSSKTNLLILTIIGLLVVGMLTDRTSETLGAESKSTDQQSGSIISNASNSNSNLEDRSALRQAINAASYNSRQVGKKQVARNQANRLKAEFDESGVKLSSTSPSESWQTTWRLKSAGLGNAQKSIGSGKLRAAGSRVEIERLESGLVEWFKNEPGGLEHGFTLNERPAAGYDKNANLRLVIEIAGDLIATANRNEKGLILTNNDGKELLRYKKLLVFDANRKEQKATLAVHNNEVFLEVEEGNAKYPLTIDPTFETQKLIPTSGLGNNFQYGTSVAISGDTAIVGAPQTGTGRAWVFVKTGATWTQQQHLTASDGVNGSKFGVSVAIEGDIILVGAWRKQIAAAGNYANAEAY